MWNDPETNSRLFMYRTNNYKTLKVSGKYPKGNGNCIIPSTVLSPSLMIISLHGILHIRRALVRFFYGCTVFNGIGSASGPDMDRFH
jgi:hypothetical protein